MHGSAIAFLLTAGGLAASFFHLGRPGPRVAVGRALAHVVAVARGHRAAGVHGCRSVLRHRAPLRLGAALATLPSGVPVGATLVLGVAGTLLAVALFVCTGMIYACVAFLREWATPLTVVNFIVLGCASGFALAAAFATAAAPALVRFYVASALILTLLGFATRTASLVRNARLRPKSTLQTAIGDQASADRPEVAGLHGRVLQYARVLPRRDPPRSCARSSGCSCWARSPCLRSCSSAALAGAPAIACVAAFAVQYVGLLAERWFFFAQANHPQNLYYQSIA